MARHAQAVLEFKRTRASTNAFSNQVEGDLRRCFFAHLTLGDLDGYQWLLLLSRHTLRHVLQIQAIKTDPAYPVSFQRR